MRTAVTLGKSPTEARNRTMLDGPTLPHFRQLTHHHDICMTAPQTQAKRSFLHPTPPSSRCSQQHRLPRHGIGRGNLLSAVSSTSNQLGER